MASAIGPAQLNDLPLRKPPACEPRGSDLLRVETVRQAFGADVVGSALSPRAQLGYRVLVDHINRGRDPRRPYDGKVFLTDETFAAELGGVSKRQVQRIRSELLAGGWICLPYGDAGGRGNSTIWYHLHPEGCPCARMALTPLKQRTAAAQANARRAAKRARQPGELRRELRQSQQVTVSRSLKIVANRMVSVENEGRQGKQRRALQECNSSRNRCEAVTASRPYSAGDSS
jgi:hypothetical protein